MTLNERKKEDGLIVYEGNIFWCPGHGQFVFP